MASVNSYHASPFSSYNWWTPPSSADSVSDKSQVCRSPSYLKPLLKFFLNFQRLLSSSTQLNYPSYVDPQYTYDTKFEFDNSFEKRIHLLESFFNLSIHDEKTIEIEPTTRFQPLQALKVPPSNYMCHLCFQPGHFIINCTQVSTFQKYKFVCSPISIFKRLGKTFVRFRCWVDSWIIVCDPPH